MGNLDDFTSFHKLTNSKNISVKFAKTTPVPKVSINNYHLNSGSQAYSNTVQTRLDRARTHLDFEFCWKYYSRARSIQ